MPPTIEQRVANLEKGVDVLNVKMDNLSSNITEHFATKADLAATEINMIRWYIATTLVLVGVIIGVAAIS